MHFVASLQSLFKIGSIQGKKFKLTYSKVPKFLLALGKYLVKSADYESRIPLLSVSLTKNEKEGTIFVFCLCFIRSELRDGIRNLEEFSGILRIKNLYEFK